MKPLINGQHIPAMNKNIIRRKSLLDKLDQIKESRLALVSAPAGYGKTTAVFDWLNHCEMPFVWLSLNEYNTSPSAFWKAIYRALDNIIPGISHNSEYILATPELLHANVQINLFSDAIAAAGQEFVFVLDDVHLISDPIILKGLSYFIDYMPANLHLILISRTEPELEFAKYRIKWQMRIIDKEDLRFHKDDILRFYQARGLLLKDDEVQRLETYTEGWAASLVAVAMTMEKDHKRPLTTAELHALNGDINRYLRDDVISGWPEEKWTFAMQTSILDMLSEAVCNAVTGEENAGRMLTELYKDNGFLTLLDSRGNEYRFHHLFRDFASKRLIEDDPALVSELHARAGFWYRENKSIDHAIDHFLSAGLYEEALELIENKDVYNMYDNSVLLSWIERLPRVLRDNSFMVAYIFSKYYMEIERYDLVRVWGERMRTLEALPKYALDPESAAFCQIACALSEANLLLRESNPHFVIPFMTVFEQFDPRYYKMPEYYDFNTSDIYFHRCPISHMARLFGERQDEYEAIARKYRTLITKNPGYKPLAAGEFLYESGKQDEALPYLLEAREEARSAGCMGALVPTLADIARVRRAAGDYAGAFETLEECRLLLQESGKLHWNQMVSALRCRFLIDYGDTAQVDQWLSSCRIDIYGEISRIREFEFLVYARALLMKGLEQDAEILLQRLLAFMEKANRLHSRVEVLNLLALLLYQKGLKKNAFAYLNRSLTIGREQSYIRSYLDEGEAMADLMAAYSKDPTVGNNKANAEFAAALLQRMRLEQPSAALGDGFLDCLTPREREVLSLLTEAYTNKEISGQMGVTLHTIKYHLGNIYGKLGVKNRAQCLKLVREHSGQQN